MSESDTTTPEGLFEKPKRRLRPSKTDELTALRARVAKLEQISEHSEGEALHYATEAAALRAEVERLRAALEEIESITVHSGGDIHGISAPAWQAAFNHAHIVARAALGDTHE